MSRLESIESDIIPASIASRTSQSTISPRTNGRNRGISCLSEQLFGCTICTVNDSEIRPPGIRRIGNAWVPDQGVGDSEVEDGSYFGESDEDPLDDGDASQIEDLRTCGGGAPHQPTPRSKRHGASRSPAHVVSTLDAKSKAGERQLEEELEALIWSTGDLFVSRGWDLVHSRDDRYTMNGRGIRLFLLPLGIPAPDSVHLANTVGVDAAQRAGRIMVNDGPLRQPLLDYLLQTGHNEHYDARGTENSAAVTGAAKHLEFNPPPYGDRIEAMRHATQQADMRRRIVGPPVAAAVGPPVQALCITTRR